MIAKRSKKRAKQEREYAKLKAEYLKDRHCEYPGCYSNEVTLHHSAGRVGNLLTDVRYFKALCWQHHSEVELNPLRAKELGLSKSRLDVQ
ncbi:MAG: hypothetical protein K0S09_51 [Sphingobacteriaceae bacterium]|jgi:hypothetical protein|nr:hypothetical protein [Sphingobacteriaceae bacterium]